MARLEIKRDSAEYVEVISEVFVELVQKSARAAIRCEHEGDEITPALVECLHYIHLHGKSPVREVARGLQISLSAASQLVDRLVKKGLAQRRENEADRRLALVDTTESGRKIVEQTRKKTSEWFASVVDAMPSDERRAFMQGIEGVLSAALADQENLDWACAKCGEIASFCVVRKIKEGRECR